MIMQSLNISRGETKRKEVKEGAQGGEKEGWRKGEKKKGREKERSQNGRFGLTTFHLLSLPWRCRR